MNIYRSLLSQINQADSLKETAQISVRLAERSGHFKKIELWCYDRLPHYPFLSALFDPSSNQDLLISYLRRVYQYHSAHKGVSRESVDKESALAGWMSLVCEINPTRDFLQYEQELSSRLAQSDAYSMLFPEGVNTTNIKTIIEDTLWTLGESQKIYSFVLQRESKQTVFFMQEEGFGKNLRLDLSGEIINALDLREIEFLQDERMPHESFGLFSYSPKDSHGRDAKQLVLFLTELVSQQIQSLRERNRQNALALLSGGLRLSKDASHFFQNAAEIIRKVLDAESAAILRPHSNSQNELFVEGVSGFKNFSGGLLEFSHKEPSIIQDVFMKAEPVRLKDIRVHPHFHMGYYEHLSNYRQDPGKQYEYVSNSFCAVPIMFDDKCLGVVQVLGKQESAIFPHFSEHDQRLLISLSEKLAQASLNYDFVEEQELNTAQITHSLKSPLTNIRGWNDAIGESLRYASKNVIDDFPPLQDIIESQIQINNTIARANDFIETTIYSIRSKYTGFEQEVKGRIDVEKIVTEIVGSYKPYYKRYNKMVHINPNLELLPPLYGQPRKIRLVFANLIDNAMKYAHSNEWIKIFKSKFNNDIVIENIGMRAYRDETERKLLLDPFFRTSTKDPRRFIFGTGLGLPLCRQIIEEHNGSLTIETKRMDKHGEEDNGTNYMTRVLVKLK